MDRNDVIWVPETKRITKELAISRFQWKKWCMWWLLTLIEKPETRRRGDRKERGSERWSWEGRCKCATQKWSMFDLNRESKITKSQILFNMFILLSYLPIRLNLLVTWYGFTYSVRSCKENVPQLLKSAHDCISQNDFIVIWKEAKETSLTVGNDCVKQWHVRSEKTAWTVSNNDVNEEML